MAQSGKAPRISYGLHDDAAPEAENVALRNVYRYIVDRAKRNAAGMTSTNGGDAKERSKDDSSGK
jgi:hypothetical protein